MLRTACYAALFAAVSFAQTSHSAHPPAPPAAAEPVLSIHGVCPEPKAASSGAEDCVTVVTRQQFDDWMSAMAPETQVTASMKQSLARTYAEVLAFNNTAAASGLSNSQRYRTMMQWLQWKTLADLFRRRLEQESSAVPDAEIDEYYRDQTARFEEVRLSRLVLPRNNFGAADRQKFEADAERIAAGLRDRAASGEDLESLQKEAYATLGFNGQPPATSVGDCRRASLPAGISDEVFSLRPGEVSKVEKETYSFVIYKVEARRTLPEKQVKAEISRELSSRKLEQALRSITANIRTEWNEKYFGAVPAQ